METGVDFDVVLVVAEERFVVFAEDVSDDVEAEVDLIVVVVEVVVAVVEVVVTVVEVVMVFAVQL